jgi:pimeloyl-ACP methyl ester carboxylesterase
MADSSSGPTVVLVHGAFADAGSWALVTERLIAAGVPVTAIVNPLRGVASDAAYVASFINQIDGTVLAVGHSYGGAIITNAVSRTTNVVGLVYVAAFAPDEGETVAGIIGRSKDSILTTAMLEYRYPTGNGDETATELIIDPTKFRDVFSADLPQRESDVYGLSQRPIAAGALGEQTSEVAWRVLRTSAVVGTADVAAGSDVVRSTAQRADATIIEIDGSHSIMISQPDAVTDVILTARKAVDQGC